MKKSKRKPDPLFEDIGFEEALQRLLQTDKGELEEAMLQEFNEGLEQTRARIKEAREDIARGARTTDPKDRFRL
jgi:hypothetical protein